jgi:hypothetical protein
VDGGRARSFFFGARSCLATRCSYWCPVGNGARGGLVEAVDDDPAVVADGGAEYRSLSHRRRRR